MVQCCVSWRQYRMHMLQGQCICFLILGFVALSVVAWWFEDGAADIVGSETTGYYLILIGGCVLMCVGGCYCTGAVSDTQQDRAVAKTLQLHKLQEWARQRQGTAQGGVVPGGVSSDLTTLV